MQNRQDLDEMTKMRCVRMSEREKIKRGVLHILFALLLLLGIIGHCRGMRGDCLNHIQWFNEKEGELLFFLYFKKCLSLLSVCKAAACLSAVCNDNSFSD